jgi:hypothetical protein
MMRWAVLVLSFALVAPSVAAAETLEHVVALDDGGQVYVDKDSLRRLPPVPGDRAFPVVQIWAFYDLSGNRREKARSARALINFNCARRTSNVVAYKKTLPSGAKLYDWQSADIDFKYEAVVPESQMDELLRHACGFPRARPLVPVEPVQPTQPQNGWLVPVPSGSGG